MSFIYCVCFTITCIQLPYLQCIPRSVHRVRMSSFCVKDTVCFRVLIHELVIRVYFTDTGAIPCISTSGSIARGVIHEIGWKKLKKPGHAYMILGMHCSSFWYMWCDYMHLWNCFMYNFTWSFYMLCTLSEMTNKRWTINQKKLISKIYNSMEFLGTRQKFHKIPWNSMEPSRS